MPKKKRAADTRALSRVLRFVAAAGALVMLVLVFTDFGAGTDASAGSELPGRSRQRTVVDVERELSLVTGGAARSRPEESVPGEGGEGALQLDLPGMRSVAPASGIKGAATPTIVDRVRVVVSTQELELFAGVALVRRYPVSTAKNGVGSARGSQRTPLGRHRVHSKFGAGEPLGMVFETRRPTGRIAEIFAARTDGPEDVITTRILWLEGLEDGKNRGGEVDSHSRYIYIHGTNEEGLIGAPASHGCVRMKNRDVLELFELVAVGTPVEIVESQR